MYGSAQAFKKELSPPSHPTLRAWCGWPAGCRPPRGVGREAGESGSGPFDSNDNNDDNDNNNDNDIAIPPLPAVHNSTDDVRHQRKTQGKFVWLAQYYAIIYNIG